MTNRSRRGFMGTGRELFKRVHCGQEKNDFSHCIDLVVKEKCKNALFFRGKAVCKECKTLPEGPEISDCMKLDRENSSAQTLVCSENGRHCGGTFGQTILFERRKKAAHTLSKAAAEISVRLGNKETNYNDI